MFCFHVLPDLLRPESLSCFIDFVELRFMNYRHEMFKYQEIQSTADKMDAGNNG